jgi:hypothetical protein
MSDEGKIKLSVWKSKTTQLRPYEPLECGSSVTESFSEIDDAARELWLRKAEEIVNESIDKQFERERELLKRRKAAEDVF